jgi:hypothetical protein
MNRIVSALYQSVPTSTSKEGWERYLCCPYTPPCRSFGTYFILSFHPPICYAQPHNIIGSIPQAYLSMDLQPFVAPWPHFKFLNPIHSRQDSVDGGSARRKAATYTEINTNRINAHRHPCLEWDSNPRSQRSRESEDSLMTQTARPLWSVYSWGLSLWNSVVSFLFSQSNVQPVHPNLLTLLGKVSGMVSHPACIPGFLASNYGRDTEYRDLCFFLLFFFSYCSQLQRM